MPRIILLDTSPEVITGGQRYNHTFVRVLSETLNAEIVYFPFLNKKYPRWKMIFVPFIEIFELKKFKKDDIIFYRDTSFKRHILLLFFARLFKGNISILIIHHYLHLGENGIKRKIIYILEWIYSSMVKYLIVPSPYTKDIAQKMFPRKQIIYIPLPFDVQYKFSEKYVKGNILFVGTIEPRKGLLFLFKSLKILMDSSVNFHVDIVGKCTNNAYRLKLDNYIKRNGLTNHIQFHGRVSNKELDKFYSDAELFVLPSLLEGFGIVLVEAMQHGLPIVAFDNSAMPYTIHSGENGFLARNLDCCDLAKKIKLILDDDNLRSIMQKNIPKILLNLPNKNDFYKSIEVFSRKLMSDYY